MQAHITQHSKERIIERTEGVSSFVEAKRIAKQAWLYGNTINYYQSYDKFFSYLQNKKSQTNSCSVRVYKGNIYVWRGKKRKLMTAHPIPKRYIKEMEKKNIEESQDKI
jgi:hypothetical protein